MMNLKRRPRSVLHDALELNIAVADDDPRIRDAKSAVDAIEARLAQATKRRDTAIARRRQSNSAPSAQGLVAAAAALIRGGSIPAAAPADEIEAANTETLVLRRALCAANEALQDALGTVGYETALRLRDEVSRYLEFIFAALGDLHDGLEEIRRLRGRVALAGMRWRDDLLPVPLPALLVAFGDPHAAPGASAAAAARARCVAAGLLQEKAAS
jgi:hypothetical protein